MLDPFATTQTFAGAARGGGPGGFLPPTYTLDRAAPRGISAGALGYGSGGPVHLDAYGTKRAPSPQELVNGFKAIAYACISLNAVGVAKVPLRLYALRRPGDRAPRRHFARASDATQRRLRAANSPFSRSIGTHDEVDEILGHPLLDALDAPNPFFDRQLLLMYLAASMDCIGQGFVFPTRPAGPDGLSDPTWAASELWPLQAQYVYPTRSTSGELVSSWRYFSDIYHAKEIVRVRHLSLRDPYLSGYAPLHACFEQTSLVDYYTATVEGILKGGARPDVVMTLKDPMQRAGDDERERFETEINLRRTRDRQGRVWVVDGAYEAKTLSYPPTDLGGLELTKEQRLLAANCFGVPISLLQLEDSNRATAQESTHQHQYYAIEPRCTMIASALTAQLARPVDDRLFFAFDDAVSRDKAADATVFDLKIKNGTLTINEARAEDQLPPVPWGDEPWLPSTLAQPSAAAKAAEGEPGGPAPATVGPAPDDVQAQALNGAQISSMVEVIQNVRDGVIPPESAKPLLAAAFPALTPEEIEAIIGPIVVQPPPEPAPALSPVPSPHPEPEPHPAERSDLDARFLRLLDSIEGQFAHADRDRPVETQDADTGDGAGNLPAEASGASPE